MKLKTTRTRTAHFLLPDDREIILVIPPSITEEELNKFLEYLSMIVSSVVQENKLEEQK